MENQYTTCFAPAGRSSEEQLHQQASKASCNPVVDSVMHSVGGLLLVLNENRQIIAVNDQFMRSLNLATPEVVLGFRLGEVLKCQYSDMEPDGCGTSRYCVSCTAAIAMLGALTENKPKEVDCAVRVRGDNDEEQNKYFRIRCTPIELGDHKCLLVFLRDKTTEQYRASLERIFFHDLKNVVSSLNLSTECFLRGEDETKREVFGQKIKEATQELVHEVEVQSSLLENAEDRNSHHVFYDACKVSTIVSEIEHYCDSHPAAQGKELRIDYKIGGKLLIKTDRTLLKRVLANMIINGFEESKEGEMVRLEIAYSSAEDALEFRVHNAKVIPESVQLRIFQRNFTTKDGSGRGLGTFSMKLIGEQYLGGRVTFSSDIEHGTVFTFSLPLH